MWVTAGQNLLSIFEMRESKVLLDDTNPALARMFSSPPRKAFLAALKAASMATADCVCRSRKKDQNCVDATPSTLDKYLAL